MSNWRDDKSAEQCLSHLCMSENLSDITFTFKGEPAIKLHAHKFVLCMRSEVFERMFHGLLPETNREIELTDIISSTMKILLRYMYSDEVRLDGLNILLCLYAAKKYALEGLVKKCSVFLKECLSVPNVCLIYEHSKLYDMKDLEKNSFEFILKHTTEVFNDPSFLKLSRANLEHLLTNENLCCDEKDIFQAVKKWAEHQCKVNKTAVNPTNLRKYFGEILYLIRFPVMPLNDFASIIVPTEILSNEEQLQLFKAMTLSPMVKQPKAVGRFSSIKRKEQCFSLDLSTVLGASRHSAFNNYNATSCYFSFRVSKKVKIHALSGSFISQIKSIHGPVVQDIPNYYHNTSLNVQIPSTSIEYYIDDDWLIFSKPLIISPEQMNILIFQLNASFPARNNLCYEQYYDNKSYVNITMSNNGQCSLEKEGLKLDVWNCPKDLKFVQVSHV